MQQSSLPWRNRRFSDSEDELDVATSSEGCAGVVRTITPPSRLRTRPITMTERVRESARATDEKDQLENLAQIASKSPQRAASPAAAASEAPAPISTVTGKPSRKNPLASNQPPVASAYGESVPGRGAGKVPVMVPISQSFGRERERVREEASRSPSPDPLVFHKRDQGGTGEKTSDSSGINDLPPGPILCLPNAEVNGLLIKWEPQARAVQYELRYRFRRLDTIYWGSWITLSDEIDSTRCLVPARKDAVYCFQVTSNTSSN